MTDTTRSFNRVETMILRHSGIARDCRGQALVEAAMTILLLLVCIFAIWEGGRVLQVQQALTDAAREGARRSVAPLTQTLPGTLATTSDVQGVVQSFLQAASISVPNGNITVDQGVTIGTTTFTRVTVTYPYHVMTLSMFGSLNNMTLTGESLMRNETSP
jgi:Flp pilus assembly protein TadG